MYDQNVYTYLMCNWHSEFNGVRIGRFSRYGQVAVHKIWILTFLWRLWGGILMIKSDMWHFQYIAIQENSQEINNKILRTKYNRYWKSGEYEQVTKPYNKTKVKVNCSTSVNGRNNLHNYILHINNSVLYYTWPTCMLHLH